MVSRSQVLGWVAPRESRAPSTGARDNLTLDCRKHSKVAAEAGDMLADNLPDQSDTLVIPINLGGIRGAITARFIKFPFHDPLNSEGYQYDLA